MNDKSEQENIKHDRCSSAKRKEFIPNIFIIY